MTEPILESLYELTQRARDDARRPAAAFDPSSSPLHGKAVFLVGAPRSGTTWLQQMLAVHPEVATSGESHLFCEGVERLYENHEEPEPFLLPHQHLGTWVARAELHTLVRSLVDGLFERMRERVRPTAGRVLDKTPNHRLHAALLAELYPDAAFIHIVRDGRDVAGSARDLWGWSADWQGSSAARTWSESVSDVRRHLGPRWYHEVRYEDLVTHPERELAAIFRAVDLDAPDALVASAVSFARTPINVRPSDERLGVRKRAAEARGQRQTLAIAGPLLADLGYVTEAEVAKASAPRRSDAILGAAVVRRAQRAWWGARERRRRAAEVATSRRLREQGRALAEAAVDGREAELRSMLTAEVEVSHDGSSTRGTSDAVSSLLGSASGSSIVAVEADAHACAVQLVSPSGVRVLHRYWFDGDGARRIAIQSGAQASPR